MLFHPLPDLGRNIKCGNFLIKPDLYMQPELPDLDAGSGCLQRRPRSLAELRSEVVRDGQGVARAVFTPGALPWWLRCGMFSVRFVRLLLETAAYLLIF